MVDDLHHFGSCDKSKLPQWKAVERDAAHPMAAKRQREIDWDQRQDIIFRNISSTHFPQQVPAHLLLAHSV